MSTAGGTYIVSGAVGVCASACFSHYAHALLDDHCIEYADAVLCVGQITLLWSVRVGAGRIARGHLFLVDHINSAFKRCKNTTHSTVTACIIQITESHRIYICVFHFRLSYVDIVMRTRAHFFVDCRSDADFF